MITSEDVSAAKVVLKFENVGLTDEQFWQLCRDKRLDNPTSITGDPVLPGFVFNVAEIC